LTIQKAFFRVVGLSCATCKPIIEKQLSDEQGIRSIGVDIMMDRVIVEYDSDMITREKIKEKLENSGYKFSSRVGPT
jgi:Cu+-exporting ATPase